MDWITGWEWMEWPFDHRHIENLIVTKGKDCQIPDRAIGPIAENRLDSTQP